MNISLQPATIADAAKWLDLQIEAFTPLLAIYQDHETSPATETIERILGRMNNPRMHHFFILADGTLVGGVRVSRYEGTAAYRLNSIFVLPACQSKGIGQIVMEKIEAQYPQATSWSLDTLLQETRNLHFYEKLGYRRTGEEQFVNERLTLVAYEKHLLPS